MDFLVPDLPTEPLAAAAAFHGTVLPEILARLAALSPGDHATLRFAAADHTHKGWRLAVVQELARAHAPARVNAVSGGSAEAVAEACAWLARAPGVTGQLLPLADAAGPPGPSVVVSRP